MNYHDASPLQQFLFMSMITVALKMREIGKKKKDYLIFAEETWNSMMMTDIDELQNIVVEIMKKELKEMQEKNDKTCQ